MRILRQENLRHPIHLTAGDTLVLTHKGRELARHTFTGKQEIDTAVIAVLDKELDELGFESGIAGIFAKKK